MKRKWGLFLFLLSFLVWGLVFTLPLLPLSNSARAAIGVLIYLLSYGFFFASGWVLSEGKRPTLSKTLLTGKQALRSVLAGRRPRR